MSISLFFLLPYQHCEHCGNHCQLLLQCQQMENKNTTLPLCEHEIKSHCCFQGRETKM